MNQMDTPGSVKSAAFASKLELGKRLFMDSVLISVLVAFPGASAADQLEASFLNPPPSARPWAYWMWLDGNVTRAGLTADLEAMQRAGMGGAILFDVTQDIPRGPVRFNSPGWRELFKHTVSE